MTIFAKWFERRKNRGARGVAAAPARNGFRRKVLFEAIEGRVLLSGDFGIPPADINDAEALPDPDALNLNEGAGGEYLLGEPISAPSELPDDQVGDLASASEVIASGDSLSLAADGEGAVDEATGFVAPLSMQAGWVMQESMAASRELIVVDGNVPDYQRLVAGILGADVSAIEELFAAAAAQATTGASEVGTADPAEEPVAGETLSLDFLAQDGVEPEPLRATWVAADGRQVDIVLLNAHTDGVAQVTDLLGDYTALTAVHILSHGIQGQVRLGNTYLNSARIEEERDVIAGWGNALAAGGDILLYGCDVASGDGITFIDTLAALTGTAGNDTLTSTAGNDTLTGLAGNDTYVFSNGFGEDTVVETGSGGSSDTLNFSAVSSALTFTFKVGGKIEVTSGTNKVTASNVENIIGGSGTNTFIFEEGASIEGDLTGTNVFTFQGAAVVRLDLLKNTLNRVGGTLAPTLLASTVTTGSGIDQVLGDNSNETFNTGAGNDVVAGNGGNDTINAGDGDDRIYDQKVATGVTAPATTGNDTFAGGDGDDTYIFSRVAGDWGQDKVVEAASEGADTIDLTAVTAVLAVQVADAATGFTVTQGSNTLNGSTAGVVNVEILKLGTGENTITVQDAWLDGLRIINASATPNATLDLSAVTADLEIELGGDGAVTVTDVATGAKLLLEGIVSIKSGTGNNTFFVTGDDALPGVIEQTATKDGGKTNVLDYTRYDGTAQVGVDMTAARATGLNTDTQTTGAVEVKTLSVDSATGGSFLLGFGAATEQVAWDATADDLKAVLEGYASVGSVAVTGAGTTADPFEITFTGIGEWDVDDLVIDDSGLEGTGASVASATGTEGATGLVASAFAGVGKVVFGNGMSVLYAGADEVAVDATRGDVVVSSNDAGAVTFNADGRRANTSLWGSSAADNVTLGDGADVVYGAGGDDVIDGGAGNDLLDGGDGSDTLKGGSGNDRLIGGADNDTLEGGSGDDTLDGGVGTDTLKGGAGNDTYLFNDGWGTDTITEVPGGGDGDVVDFSAVTAAMTFVMSNGMMQAGTGVYTPDTLQSDLKGLTASSGNVTGSFSGGDLLTVGSDIDVATTADPHDKSFFAIEEVKLPAADTTILFGNDWGPAPSTASILTPEFLSSFFDSGDRELVIDSSALVAAGKNLILDFRQVIEGLEFSFEKVEDLDENGEPTGTWHVQVSIEKSDSISLPLMDDPLGEVTYGKLTITHIDANTTIFGGREANTFGLDGDVVVDADIIGGEGVRAGSNFLNVDTLNTLLGLEIPDVLVKNTLDYTGSDYFDANIVKLYESSGTVATSLQTESDGEQAVQKLAVTGTGGNFTLTHGGQTTAAITWDADDATLAASIQVALDNKFGPNKFAVAASDTDTFLVTFAAKVDQPLFTANDGALTGTGAGVTISEFKAGALENARQSFGYSAEAGTFTLTYDGQVTTAINWNATAADVKAALEALSPVTTASVTGTGKYNDPFVITFETANLDSAGAFHELTADSRELARSDQKIKVGTATQGAGPVTELQQITSDADGGTFTLAFGAETTAAIAWDAGADDVKAALEALTAVNTVNVLGQGTAAAPWIIEFVDQTTGSNDVGLLVLDGTGLTGGAAEVELLRDGSDAAPVNEAQYVESSLTSGSFYLSYNGQRTDAIAWNASAADVKAALEALNPQVGTAVETIVEGSDLLPETEQQLITVAATSGTFTLTFAGQTTTALAWNASAADVKVALEALSNITEVLVTDARQWGASWHVDFITQSTGGNDVPALVVNNVDLAREKLIEVSVVRSGAAGAYLWDITFTGPAAADVPQLAVVEPGSYTQTASQFTGKLLNISGVNYGGAANLMVGSNMGVPASDLQALFADSNFLSDPKVTFETWFNGLSASVQNAILSGNILGADRFEVGGNPITDTIEGLGEDGSALVESGVSLLGSLAGQFVPDTFSPGVHILAGMTGGDTYAFSGVWGLAAVIEVPDIIIGGITVPEAFDTLDLSGVDADLEITVYEITTANLATFQKLFADVQSDKSVLATNPDYSRKIEA